MVVFAASMSFFHSRETAGENETFPAVSHDMFPEAICPLPSLFNFHFVPLVIEPSLPSTMFPLRMEEVSTVQPAILFWDPKRATHVPVLFVAYNPKSLSLL